MLDDSPNDDIDSDARNPAVGRVSQRQRPAPGTPAPAVAPETASLALSSPRKGGLRRQLLGAAAVVLVAATGYYAVNWWTFGRFQVTTDDAYVAARAATISPKVAGYVTEIAVADNAPIKTGALIARIDAGDYQLAARAGRDQIQIQHSTIARIEKQVVAQQAMADQARAQANAARAAAQRAESDFKRQTELATRQINSAQTLEQSRAARDQAVAGVAAADAAVASAVANVTVINAQRTEAENVLKQNETSLAKAERDLSFAEIRAPFDGYIGNRAMQVGDYVQPAQRLASLVPLKEVYVDANFKETQLARLRPGQRVKITVDAVSGRDLEGAVVSVAPASGSVFSLLPPDNATGNFTKIVQRVTVRIAVPPEMAAQSILRPGMSVTVSVNTKPEKAGAAAH